MKQFTLLRNNFKIFNNHIDKKFEELMTDHLDITNDEKEQIIHESINEWFDNWKMCKHINYALQQSNTYHRYEYDTHGIIRVEYDPHQFSSPRFNNGENFCMTEKIIRAERIDTEVFKRKFYEWSKEWFMERTDLVMKQILFKWCISLDNTGIINQDRLIYGNYDELVKTYETIQGEI